MVHCVYRIPANAFHHSGQCFSSEAWGGRSANRGQCAQACRLPYDLIVDDEYRPLDDLRYLLSPGDLYTIEQVPEMIEAGISTLKIEGRYKNETYVALTTNAYRRAVDAAWEGRANPIEEIDALHIQQVYSRGMGPYFLSGTDHQAVVHGRSPRHRGLLIGKVTRVYSDHVAIEPTTIHHLASIKAGDGIVFDAADWRSPQEVEEGGRLYEVRQAGSQLALYFGNRTIDFGRIRKGDWVWRTHDVDTDKTARPFLDNPAPVQKQPVNVHVIAHEGEPLGMTWTLVKTPDVAVQVVSDQPLGQANQRLVSDEYLHGQLNRLGNTAYTLNSVKVDIVGAPFIPSSILNRLRQQAVERLTEQQAKPRIILTHDPVTTLKSSLDHVSPKPSIASSPVQLHVLVRTPEQLDAAINLRPDSITLDYLELYGLRPSIEKIKATGITPRVASPRVLKPQEQRIVNFLLRLDCAIVVRSGGLLEALRGRHQHPLIGDFSLNIALQPQHR